MLEPRKIKRRKPHQPQNRGKATRGLEVIFGEFGLKAKTSGWVTNKTIEAARRAMVRYTRKGGKIWIRIFPDRIITAKSNVVPMGKGKGGPDRFIAAVQRGQILFEMSGISEEMAREALIKAGHKVGVKSRVVVKGEIL